MRIPWSLKLTSKLLLSRLPLNYRLFSAVGLFRHGAMNTPDYSIRTFGFHFKKYCDVYDRRPNSLVELGPGDSVSSALIAAHQGCSGPIWLVDAGKFATSDVETYLALADVLGFDRKDQLADFRNGFDGALANWNATYLTNGVASLSSIPDQSVDFCFSQSVLEHVRKRDIPSLLQQLSRVLKPGGLISAHVDLKDHLGGGLNNLRFSERLWESEWFARSGFYTNRLGAEDWQKMFVEHSFTILDFKRKVRDKPCINRSMLSPEFRSRSDCDLLTSSFYCMLAKL